MVLADRDTTTRGDADNLLIGIATDDAHRALLHWQSNTPGLHPFVPDLHRLWLEHWIWTFRDVFAGKDVLDIGAQNPRRWLGEGYRTFGHTADVTADIKGDLLDGLPEWWDAIICTEVLEHCENPIAAVANIHKALKPGGVLLVTSPFIWPWHGTDDYDDFWRMTRQGWQLLLRKFKDVEITAVPWTSEAAGLLDLVRRFEGWGFRHHVEFHTGYLCSGVKEG